MGGKRGGVSTGVNSVVHDSAKVGRNVKIWNLVYVGEGTIIGDDTMIGSLSHIDREVVIGKACRIQGMVYIPARCVVGDYVFIGPGSVLLNDKYPPSKGRWDPVTIEDYAVIGGNVTILPGVRVGRGAKVGGGSVVTKSLEPGKVYVGNPAREFRGASRWR